MKLLYEGPDAVNGRGVCPHCDYPSYFKMATSLNTSYIRSIENISCVAECQNCGGPILLVGFKDSHSGSYEYWAHYPEGKPNESIPDEIPKEIGEDFKEALRCQFVKAYKATAIMCRRALQSSCQELGADDDRLASQIDDLAEKGKITVALKDMAHRGSVNKCVNRHQAAFSSVTWLTGTPLTYWAPW